MVSMAMMVATIIVPVASVMIVVVAGLVVVMVAVAIEATGVIIVVARVMPHASPVAIMATSPTIIGTVVAVAKSQVETLGFSLGRGEHSQARANDTNRRDFFEQVHGIYPPQK